ncbi:MAG: dihydroorotase [Myxococcota bacterium]|nr:dihydroorotase [Myxococcota bacterium]
MNQILFKGVRVIDPVHQLDGDFDVLLKGEKIAAVEPVGKLKPTGEVKVLDGVGKWLTTPFVDLHTTIACPSESYKEDLHSVQDVAVAGGFGTILLIPSKEMPMDTPEIIHYIRERADAYGKCSVLPVAGLTHGLLGERLSELGLLQAAGAVGVSNGPVPVKNTQLLRNAFEYGTDFGLPFILESMDAYLGEHGDMHEGAMSTTLGLRGLPRTGEDVATARNIFLAELTGARLHLVISSMAAAECVAKGQARGVDISAHTSAHHLLMTDKALVTYDTNLKLRPPLREAEDRIALAEALKQDILTGIASHHHPQCSIEKDCTFGVAGFGSLGLQTCFAEALEASKLRQINPMKLLEKLTVGPAEVIGLELPGLTVGAPANVVMLDPGSEWRLNSETNRSKSENSAVWNRSLRGRVDFTVLDGKIAYEADIQA